MRLKSVFIWCFMVLSLLTIAQGHERAIAYPIVEEIVIDGDFSDWPSGLEKFKIANKEFGETAGPEDFSANFRIAYNELRHEIYIAIEIIDDQHLNENSEKDIDLLDYVYLYLDPIHDVNGGSSCLFQMSEFYKDYDSKSKTLNPLVPSINWDNVEAMIKRNNKVTAYEWRISIGDRLQVNKVFGFDIIVGDTDEEGGDETWFSWKEGTGKSRSSYTLGEVVFAQSKESLGSIEGKVKYLDTLVHSIRSLKITSLDIPDFWVLALVDSLGKYKVKLPKGNYQISSFEHLTTPFFSMDFFQDSRKIISENNLFVNVEENTNVKAKDLNLLTQILPIGFFEDQGVLFNQEFDRYRMDQFVRYFQEYFEIPGISIAVIKNGEVVYDKVSGFKNNFTKEVLQPTSLFEAASITKSVFAMIVLKTVEKGILDLDRPLYQYVRFPNIEHDERYKKITARHVLNHQTGLDNWPVGAYTGTLSDTKAELFFDPGTAFKYSGEAMNYLGRVIEKLTNKTLSQIFKEEFAPAFNLKHSHFCYNDELEGEITLGHISNVPWYKFKFPDVDSPASSLQSSAHDFSNFIIGLMNKNYLTTASYDLILNPHQKIEHEDRMYDKELSQGMGYGFFMVDTPQGRLIGHGGNNGDYESKFGYMPNHKNGYIVFANSNVGDQFIRMLELYLYQGKIGLN